MSIEIRALNELQDLYAAVDLQTVYWGTDVESLVPGQVMFTIVMSGGHVIAAYDGAKMIGVLIGFLAAYDQPAHEHLKIYSKRMVVLPEYRGQGIAQQLKLKQRELAMVQGINLVTWTFDPLLSVNAHFNIRKLGCISRAYIIDYYGSAPDDVGLTILGRSDRLLVSWIADAPGVVARVDGAFTEYGLAHYLDAGAVIVNPTPDRINPGEVVVEDFAEYATLLLEIPPQFRGLVNAMPDVARAWQAHTRTLFQQLMNQQGYIVTDFVFTQHAGRDRAFYVLERQEANSGQ